MAELPLEDRPCGAPRPAPTAAPAPAPAWYVRSRGRWSDWLAVLHPPYTAWHLGYVLVGAGLATHVSIGRLGATLLAFALAVGVAAHALDELRGRPLGTAIPTRTLVAASAAALAVAVALGGLGISRIGWGLAGFIAPGALVVLAYNLELWGGRLHNGTTFALAWGAFPVLTAYYAQASTVRPAAVAGALYAFGLSRAQRALSTEARDLRRRVTSVSGEKTYRDGSRQAMSSASLLGPIETALVAMSWSTCAIGVAMVLARTGH